MIILHWQVWKYIGLVRLTVTYQDRFSINIKVKNFFWFLWDSESEVAQSCPTLWDPMDSSLPGSVIRGIFQSRILEWAAISVSRGSSQPRDQTWVSCIADRRFTIWATREAPRDGTNSRPRIGHHWQRPHDGHDVPQVMDTRVSACFMGTPTVRGMSVFLFYLYFANLIPQLAHKQRLCLISVTVKSSTGLTIKWCWCQLCATMEILRFWEVNLAEVLQLVRGESEGSI